MKIKQQLLKLYAFDFIHGFNITNVVWVALLLSRGFSLLDVGVGEGVFHMVSFLCEVPSGMVADILGRKRTLIASGIIAACSCLVMVASTNLLGVCISMGLNALGYNLSSGTREALTYDSLLEAKVESRYLSVCTRQNVIYQLAQAAACVTSIGMIQLGFSGAYSLAAVIAFLSAILCTQLREPIVTANQANRAQISLRQIPQKFAAHTKQSFHFLTSNRLITLKMLCMGALSAAFYISTMFVQEYYVKIGLPRQYIGIPLLGVMLCSALGASLASRFKCSYCKLALICGLLLGGALCLSAAPFIPLAVLGILLAGFVDSIFSLCSEAALQEKFESDTRATLVSVMSLCYSIFMIILSPLIGGISALLGTGIALALLGAAVMLATLIFAMLYHKFQKPAISE